MNTNAPVGTSAGNGPATGIEARDGTDTQPGQGRTPVGGVGQAGVGRRSPDASGLRTMGRTHRRGVLPKRAVRTATFAVISLAIFGCAALCLLAVWDHASEGVPWRALASLGIIAGAMGAFSVVNEVCGVNVDDDRAAW